METKTMYFPGQFEYIRTSIYMYLLCIAIIIFPEVINLFYSFQKIYFAFKQNLDLCLAITLKPVFPN